MSASYLLRFDDICPTMNWRVWQKIEDILNQQNVKPILAVVPDNQDAQLRVDIAARDFWEKVRRWQARAWSIGLHGYQHRYVTKNAGLIGRNKYSEFAGLSQAEQASKLRRSLEIFQEAGVQADLWVAPAHSYDDTTLDLLASFGIRNVSDGYAMFPYVDQRRMLFIPQQFGKFRWTPLGVWTVCMHHNTWTDVQLYRFQNDLHRYRDRIVTLQEIIQAYSQRSKQPSDNLVALGWRVARSFRQ